MSYQLRDDLLAAVADLTEKMDSRESNKYKLAQVERIVNRLGEFLGVCDDCDRLLAAVNEQIQKLKAHDAKLNSEDFREYHLTLKKVIDHLQKKHKLVPESYYMETYMPIGMCFGVMFGVLFDNIAIGIPLGLSFGVAIGSAMDADAKKKGLVI